MARIIAVVNQKGGVGKTTTSINLASALGSRDRKVLLIDLDPQANATSGLGYSKSDEKPNIYRILLGDNEIENTVIQTPYKNLSLIPSHTDLTGAEVELINVIGREFRLKEAVAKIESGYQYILIDCPPSLNILTVNALVCANELLLPIQCEYYALEGISQLLGVIHLVQERLNKQLEIKGIVLTMCDYRTNLSNQVIQEVRKYFEDKVYQTVIPRNVRLSEAPSFGKPALYYDVKSPGAESYLRLAQEIIDQDEREEKLLI